MTKSFKLAHGEINFLNVYIKSQSSVVRPLILCFFVVFFCVCFFFQKKRSWRWLDLRTLSAFFRGGSKSALASSDSLSLG